MLCETVSHPHPSCIYLTVLAHVPLPFSITRTGLQPQQPSAFPNQYSLRGVTTFLLIFKFLSHGTSNAAVIIFHLNGSLSKSLSAG
jgi:hypothetical protein